MRSTQNLEVERRGKKTDAKLRSANVNAKLMSELTKAGAPNCYQLIKLLHSHGRPNELVVSAKITIFY